MMQWLLGTALNLLIQKRTLAELAASNRTAVLQAVEVAKIRNLTRVLDTLLKDYDPKFRPGFQSGEPTRVLINVNVRSMGPISEQDMSYSMDLYFRQTWRDPRLTFVGREKTLSLGISMLDKIWKPDTYFWNGAKSYLHKLTTPNKFVRLSQDGSVYFSSRLTVKAKCPMYLHRFPLDVQTCPLILGSFSYEVAEMGYVWQRSSRKSPVTSSELFMSQFGLKTILVTNATTRTRDGVYDEGGSPAVPAADRPTLFRVPDVEYSTLTVHFVLERHMGYFLINFYAPCTLIVILSWVAFWLNREATADRIALGATSILTMTFIALDSRSDLPRVTYPTALDVYILICYGFLLTCIVEFAMVHSFTKFNTGDPEMRMFEVERISKLGLGEVLAKAVLRRRPSIQHGSAGADQDEPRWTGRYPSPQPRKLGNGVQARIRMRSGEQFASVSRKRSSASRLSRQSSAGLSKQSTAGLPACGPNVCDAFEEWKDAGRKVDPFDTEINSVSAIDRVARVVFPAAFCLISTAYWVTYVRSGPRYT